MQNSLLLGVSIGESFAEFSLLSDSSSVAQKRVYLSRESLKQSLAQFLSQQKDSKITQVFVSLRTPKKLLDFNLSGAVAHVSTEGFEHWLDICGSPAQPLTQSDLQFSVRERILADGTVELPLQIEELEAIAAKLILMNCKKVCLNFLHASAHPAHLEKAQQFFQEKGFEVFVPEKSDNPNEASRWNRNALNATISSVYTELKSELFAGLAGYVDDQNVHFLDSEGRLFQKDQGHQLEGMFAANTALGLSLQKQKADILYLGLEHFTLISPGSWESSWQSPWGAVEIRHLKAQCLGIQPTMGIHLNTFGRFDFTTHQEGWEPGPMFLGRGQKMSLLDLWSDNGKLAKLQGLEERISAQGVQRFKNSMLTLSKISSLRNVDLNHITKELLSLSVQRLALAASLRRNQQKLIITGPLASLFANIFKKDPHATVDAQEFAESEAVARWGAQALQSKSEVKS